MIRFISIPALIAAIPLLNGLALVVYMYAHPDQSLAIKVWNYLESDTFKLISGSLIIPLFFSVLEKRYSFLESLRKQREDKHRQLRDEKRAARRKVIDETLEMWRKLYDLAGKLIFFVPQKDDPEKMNSIVSEMMAFTSFAEQIVNKWSHQFPVLSRRDQDLFLEFINVLYQSSLSVAFFIQDEKDEKIRGYYQNMLYLIQDQIKSIAHHRILNSLKYALNVMELREDYAEKAAIEQAESQLQEVLKQLREWYDHLRRLDDKFDNFMSPATGKAIEELRSTARKIETWLKEDEKRLVWNHDEYWPVFEKQYNALTLEEKLASYRAPYSKEYLEALAHDFSLSSACEYIYNRAHGIW